MNEYKIVVDASMTSSDMTVMYVQLHKLLMKALEERQAAADKKRGYRIATKQIDPEGGMSLEQFSEWAKSVKDMVPKDAREHAEVHITSDYDGLDCYVSWRQPLGV